MTSESSDSAMIFSLSYLVCQLEDRSGKQDVATIVDSLSPSALPTINILQPMELKLQDDIVVTAIYLAQFRYWQEARQHYDAKPENDSWAAETLGEFVDLFVELGRVGNADTSGGGWII